MGKALVIGVTSALLGAMIWVVQAPADQSRFRPSGMAAYVPKQGDSFDFYLAENRRRLRAVLEKYYFAGSDEPFGSAYSLEDALEIRSPFEFSPSGSGCGGDRLGILFIHGLTDSPYLVKTLARSLAGRSPCATVRGLLSPGHGTVPGDLLYVTEEQWYATIAYGVESFREVADELVLVGYSNGSALALTYLDRNRDSEFIRSLVLVSPGLKSADNRSFLTPYVRSLWPWLYQRPDSDVAKYESFTTNAAAEFYQLSKPLIADGFKPIDVPAMMIASGDDTTINNRASVDFYCNKLTASNKRLVWYQSAIDPLIPDDGCDGIRLQQLSTDIANYVSYSHVALTLPADDPHYGVNGRYAVCLAYENEPAAMEVCRNDDGNTVYAENSYADESGRYKGRLIRRASFNPQYDAMVGQIDCFIRRSCQ